jgi:hypothetical protein
LKYKENIDETINKTHLQVLRNVVNEKYLTRIISEEFQEFNRLLMCAATKKQVVLVSSNSIPTDKIIPALFLDLLL